jgi:hypothetical protein
VFGVINLDGLDDHGAFYVFERFGVLRKRASLPISPPRCSRRPSRSAEPINAA